MFAPFGEIDSCTFKNEGNGVAFVSYKDHENAATALNEMNKTKNALGGIIFVSKFVSKHENY